MADLLLWPSHLADFCPQSNFWVIIWTVLSVFSFLSKVIFFSLCSEWKFQIPRFLNKNQSSPAFLAQARLGLCKWLKPQEYHILLMYPCPSLDLSNLTSVTIFYKSAWNGISISSIVLQISHFLLLLITHSNFFVLLSIYPLARTKAADNENEGSVILSHIWCSQYHMWPWDICPERALLESALTGMARC